MPEFRPPPLVRQFKELQPISSLCSLCTNTTRCALQPLNRPAALCWPQLTRQQHRLRLQPELQPFARWTPSRAESRSAGACSARWTRSSCAGTWSRGWRRSPSKTAAAGTLTSRPTRRCPAGFSGRKCPQTAPLRSTRTPQRRWTPSAPLTPSMVTGWATARRAQTPTRRTAPASPTRTSAPPRWRPSGGRGRTPDRQPSPGAGTHELQVRSKSARSETSLTLWPTFIWIVMTEY